MSHELERAITDYEVTHAMLTYGGGFVRQLAVLFNHADAVHQARLKAAFPDYWSKYADFARVTSAAEIVDGGPDA